MDWIERVFRINPDGGSGAVEGLLIASLLMVAATVTWRTLARRR